MVQIHLGLPFSIHSRSSEEEPSASNGKAEGANPSGSTFSKRPRSPIAEASVSETDQCRCNSDRGYHFVARASSPLALPLIQFKMLSVSARFSFGYVNSGRRRCLCFGVTRLTGWKPVPRSGNRTSVPGLGANEIVRVPIRMGCKSSSLRHLHFQSPRRLTRPGHQTFNLDNAGATPVEVAISSGPQAL